MVDSILTHYQTKDGDVLDVICQKHYPNTDQALAAVLAYNPSLSDFGPVLPAGILITIPDLGVSELKTIRLWS